MERGGARGLYLLDLQASPDRGHNPGHVQVENKCGRLGNGKSQRRAQPLDSSTGNGKSERRTQSLDDSANAYREKLEK